MISKQENRLLEFLITIEVGKQCNYLTENVLLWMQKVARFQIWMDESYGQKETKTNFQLRYSSGSSHVLACARATRARTKMRKQHKTSMIGGAWKKLAQSLLNLLYFCTKWRAGKLPISCLCTSEKPQPLLQHKFEQLRASPVLKA